MLVFYTTLIEIKLLIEKLKILLSVSNSKIPPVNTCMATVHMVVESGY